MARGPLSLKSLLETRQRFFAELPVRLSNNQRSFLTSLAEAKPDWSLMSCPHLAEMPAVRWKLANLERLRATNPTNPTKLSLQSSELRRRFEC
jgi:hypothetical protein